MSYVKVKILPRPYNIEFKCIGRLIFDINYVGYGGFETNRWRNSKEQYHREDGPAIIGPSGTQYWCRYNGLHREDGPAEISLSGRQYWWLNNIIYYSEENFNEEIRRRNELRKHSSLTETL